MIPLLFFGSIGTKGAIVVGFTTAELLIHYWKSRKNPPEVYIFDRRVHHGEIGALLSLSSLLFGKVPNPAALGVIAGLGTGLVIDDLADIKEWFRFRKINLFKRIR